MENNFDPPMVDDALKALIAACGSRSAAVRLLVQSVEDLAEAPTQILMDELASRGVIHNL